MLKKFIKDKYGSTALEYAMIAAIISVVIIPFLPGIGNKTQAMYVLFASKF